jgi:AP-4 complex subunit epsilon-1
MTYFVTQTLNILFQVDTGIVGSYFVQSVQDIPSALPVKEKTEYAVRLLEIVEIQCGQDGEAYARQLKNLLAAVEHDAAPEHQLVLEGIIEKVLLYIKNGGFFCRHPVLPMTDGKF